MPKIYIFYFDYIKYLKLLQMFIFNFIAQNHTRFLLFFYHKFNKKLIPNNF
jgi:hypothetical protein